MSIMKIGQGVSQLLRYANNIVLPANLKLNIPEFFFRPCPDNIRKKY